MEIAFKYPIYIDIYRRLCIESLECSSGWNKSQNVPKRERDSLDIPYLLFW